MKIIPAILTQSTDDFFSQVTMLCSHYEYFQIDIADGVFVPNTTISIQDIRTTASQHPEQFKKISCDFHLMVRDYQARVEEIQQLSSLVSVKNILIHFGVLRGHELPSIHNLGVVLNPEDSVEDLIAEFPLSSIPVIQIMTVTPGFQGSEFKPEQLEKIKLLREKGYTGQVCIDGAVNPTTLPTIVNQQYLPDLAGCGSYLTKATPEELPERITTLEGLLQSK